MRSKARPAAARGRPAELAEKDGSDNSSAAPALRRGAAMRAFRSAVWRHWKKEGRHDLPWRQTADPYKILVSEVMLQQTQVSRVREKYAAFLKKFSSARALAQAPLAEVLREWSGLGYNRRAKYLRDAAKQIADEFGGDFRRALSHPLPGVGPYTRAAVRVFAFGEPHALIETNIRTAIICHFFSSDIPIIRDREILEYAREAAKGEEPRTWHWALMDYGAYLKASGIRLNHRSAHYAKQSRFEGSLRQARGMILRELHRGPQTSLTMRRHLIVKKNRLEEALASLSRDGLIVQEKGKWRVG